MKPISKNDALIITKSQWRKLFLTVSTLTFILYVIATIYTLCGGSYFVLDYQNSQMDRIEGFFREHHIYSLLTWLFSTVEFSILGSFIINRRIYFQWPILLYLPIAILAPLINIPSFVYTIYPFVMYILLIVIEHLVSKSKAKIWEAFLRLLLATSLTIILQLMIFISKAGYFEDENHIMSLSATFIYAMEYDIALAIMLYTIALFLNREKGDSVPWTTPQVVGGSSQTSKTQSLKSLQKNLTKKQKNRLRWLYVKMYIIQLGTLILVLVIPFLLGKVVEFLIMYLAFAISRYVLGFKYSLHFKKESLCVSVSIVIFGIIALAVPFFYVNVIVGTVLGCALAILLHLSYKYKSLWLFNQAAKPDKFAVLYTFFDGNLDKDYVKMICIYKGLDNFQTLLIIEYTQCNKLSYLAKKRNYSLRMLIYKLNEAIDKLIA